MLLLITLLYSTTIAQAANYELPAIEVSAPEAPPPLSLGFDDGSLIGRNQWEGGGERIENVLPAIPGVAFSAAGGPGQTRSLFLRGAKAEHTLVLIDGMPVNDPLSPARAFDFGQIPVGDIEAIEVLKGPQSVLYGGDALGGVVKIFTRAGAARPRIFLEAGAFETFRLRASAQGFAAGFLRTRGFSSADRREGNPEPDGHVAGNLSFHRAFRLGPRRTLRAVAFYSRAKTDTDRTGGPGGDSLGTFSKTTAAAARAELSETWTHGWEGSLAASAFLRNRFDNTQGADSYAGLFWRAEGEVRRDAGWQRPRLGFTYSAERGSSNQLADPQPLCATALYAQEELSFGSFELAAGARAEKNNLYGPALTYRIGGGYRIIPETLALRAHYATAFKGPSLFQTYSTFGSTNLNPERSRGAELSLAWQGKRARGEIAAFQQGFRELVDFAPSPAPGRFFNLGRVATKGVELSGELTLRRVLLQNAFTWLSAREEISGAPLLRRPAITNNFRLSYVGTVWGVGADLRFNGRRYDLNPVDYSRQRLGSFLVAGAQGSYRASSTWKITARAENILNRRYQETSGFGTAPLSFYLGAEAEL